MNCTKCGKEIPEGENEICEECRKNLVNEIVKEEIEENEKKEDSKKENKKINFKMNKKLLIGIACAIVAILLVIILLSLCGNNSKVGNSIGNIRNYGYAAKDGNWIYYVAPNEETTKVGIYRIKEGDKEQKTKEELIMEEWDVLSLNISENYIYFIAISKEEPSETDKIDNKICRMKKDGSDLQVINDNELDNDCYEIYVVNNNVYYIGTDYNVYRTDLSGRHKEAVLENGTGYLGITDKYIIYNVENEDGTDYVTYISDLNGKNEKPIIENKRLYSVNIVGDNVYYVMEDEKADSKTSIYKVNINSGKEELLYNVSAYNMNISGDYIYYLNYADEANEDYTVSVYRLKLDGSSKEPETIKTLYTYSNYLDVVGNWIVYMDNQYTEEIAEGFINILRTDGKEEIKVYTLDYNDFSNKEENEMENVATP